MAHFRPRYEPTGPDVAIDRQGRIVAAGSTVASSGDEFALMRVIP